MGPQALQALPAEGLQEQKAGRTRATALDAEALVWVLCALSQVFRIPFLCNIPRLTPFLPSWSGERGRHYAGVPGVDRRSIAKKKSR